MKPKYEKRRQLRMAAHNASVRKCGTCTACCTTLGIRELEKPPGTPCSKLSSVKGCSIYEDRPNSCSAWSCLWRRGGFEGADRPDRLGVVMDALPEERSPGLQIFMAHEAVPGGFDKAFLFLNRLSQTSVVFLLEVDGTGRAMGRPELVDRALTIVNYKTT